MTRFTPAPSPAGQPAGGGPADARAASGQPDGGFPAPHGPDGGFPPGSLPAGGFPGAGHPVPGTGGPSAFTPGPQAPVPPGSGPPGGQAPEAGPPAPRPAVWRSAAAAVAVVAGTAVLGVIAGFIWAAVAPRAALVMVAPGEASAVHAETAAFIEADAWFSLITVVGGLISGVAGYLLAVRRHGPLAMVGVLAGAVAAAFLARLSGELPGRGNLDHLLATLPTGAHLLDVLTLGSTGALAFWPLVAGLSAGALVSLGRGRLGGTRRRRPAGAGAPGTPGAPPDAAGPA